MKNITKKTMIILNKFPSKHALKAVTHDNVGIPKIRIEKNKVTVMPVFRSKREEQRFSKVMARHAFSNARLY